ncbi:Glycoside hydrolase, family 27 [Dillenia turbinata]|uniref:Alpha-galactosidase n=1 Tax=Dillenia turbinata TaxID=194707 RepID=A0AAN8ZGD1_9MAGN
MGIFRVQLRLLVVCLSLVSLAIAARIVPPIEINENPIKESSSSSTPSRTIFDTSKYGILQLNNGLAQTPQMGWNSWNFFACDINETVIKETADALISTGLADLGYIYVNIDDCWSAVTRDLKFDLDLFIMKMVMQNYLLHGPGYAGSWEWGHDFQGVSCTFQHLGFDEDPLGIQGRKISVEGSNDCQQVWAGPLSGNRLVVALWNRCSEAANITAKWESLGLESTSTVSVRDLWKHEDVSEDAVTSFSAEVDSHDCGMYIFNPQTATLSHTDI